MRKKKIRIMDLTLEDIINASEDVKVIIDNSLSCYGKYDPELSNMRINLDMCEDFTQVCITYVHEIQHHYDWNQSMSEKEIEISAYWNYMKSSIRKYVETYLKEGLSKNI